MLRKKCSELPFFCFGLLFQTAVYLVWFAFRSCKLPSSLLRFAFWSLVAADTMAGKLREHSFVVQHGGVS